MMELEWEGEKKKKTGVAKKKESVGAEQEGGEEERYQRKPERQAHTCVLFCFWRLTPHGSFSTTSLPPPKTLPNKQLCHMQGIQYPPFVRPPTGN